ncbi:MULTISPECIES: sensor histidine kinase KdpD [Clostridium]|uniref:histidine kinase n=1 Tax=Clostridium ragsdalei P11 TaxID=1353534 RepID=A0A1A6AI21_9CLOT|nr:MULTISPECIES: HAMP domain-containing sensor histidine kinase [Clostridium]OBR89668.1 sensor histidine kinase YycG [Clostridium ragsdalei P11]QXE21065.1 sensor histidine kinase [Clostridium sp. 001]
MDSSTLLMLAAVITIASLILAFSFLIRLLQAKSKLKNILEILNDIQAGNGNHKILASPNDITAVICYKINDIVYNYEEQLASLRKATETNKQLMTSLSHDVRTPLTTLIGYLDATHKGIVQGKERETYIETARHKAHDLKDYIDVLFDWFKLNSNEETFSIQPFEISELTRDILKDWIPIFEEKTLDYDIDIPERPIIVKVDSEGYTRVINNLIQNVLTHSNASHIKVSVSNRSNQVEICITDNGKGISKEDIKHIFERLYKCDKGRSEKGSGLGLSIVQQIVKNMSGTISACSEPYKYTSFTIKFPLKK